MYELFVESTFSAAHRLADYPGNCARYHGHNWLVTVFVQAREVNALGMAVDFRDIKKALAAILERLDHADLTQLPEFAAVNPTCEVIARFIYLELKRRLASDRVQVARVRVCETATAGATYSE